MAVMRTRPSPLASFARPDHIARAANGLDERTLETLVDLRAQAGDMHVDHVGLRIEMVVPHMLEQHRAGHHLTGVLHQVFEQAELARLQDYLLASASDAMGEPVEFQIAD